MSTVWTRSLVAAALLSAVVLGGCTSVQHLELRDTPMYSLADLRSKGEEAAKRVLVDAKPVAVHLQKGDELALNLGLDVPGLILVPSPATVRLDRDLYAYFDGKQLWLSPDGNQWGRIDDHRGLRKLFGLGRGTFQVGAGVSGTGGAVLSVMLGMR